MKTYRTASSTEGLRLPHHGFLIGVLADALRLKGLLREDLLGGASYKTVQRYFAGERVEPETVEAVVKTLVEGFITQDFILPPDAGENLAARTPVTGGIFHFIRRWEAFVAEVNSNVFPVSRPEDLPVPVLRLVALDLGMRWGAWVTLRELREGVRPDWENHPLRPDALRRLIDRHRGERSVEKFAQDVGVSTQAVEGWRVDGRLPTGLHIETLAKALAKTPAERPRMEMSLRLAVAVVDVRDRLVLLCGQERIEDMIEAFVLTARLINTFMMMPLRMEPPPFLDLKKAVAWRDSWMRKPDEVAQRMWNVVVYGAGCPTGESLVPFLAHKAQFRQEVAADFMALPGDWVERTRYWMQHLGSIPDYAAYLKEHLADRMDRLPLSPEEFTAAWSSGQMRMAGFDWKPGPDWHWVTLELPPEAKAANRATQADRAASVGDLDGAIEHLRHAVKHKFDDPVLHFRLGAFLWQVGMQTGRPEMIEEGLLECHLAVQLDPQFGNARNEIAVILSNFTDRHEEAEAAFEAAEPYHGGHAHHWHCRANNYLALKRYEDAARAYQRAIDLSKDGDHTDAKFWLSVTLMALGRTKAAKELGRKVEHLTGRDPTADWREFIEMLTRSGFPRGSVQ